MKLKDILLNEISNQLTSEFNIQDLEKQLKSHDWWFNMSDDNSKYRRGEASWSQLRQTALSFIGTTDESKAKASWKKLAPKEYNDFPKKTNNRTPKWN